MADGSWYDADIDRVIITEEQIREISLLQQDLHDDIAEFVYEKLHRRPLVLPVVVEV